MVKLFFAALFALVFFRSPFIYAAAYGGGGGTQADPYQIRTPEHLNTIGANPSDWGKHFKLMSDIDMSIYTGTQYKIIGTVRENPFTGAFDGNNFCIRNLTYTTTESVHYVGLFGYILGASIQNLGLQNISISSQGSFAGGLAGFNEQGTLTACYARGSVRGNRNVGGLTGVNWGTVANCYADVSVTGNTVVGGLAGYNYSGSINSSYATGAVNGINLVGGLLGRDYWGVITHCYAACSVAGTGDWIGGLAGYDYSGTIIACYWDIQISGQENSIGGKGKDTATMMTQETFITAGWDFTDSDGNPADWMMLREGEDYPRLAWQPIYPGDIAGAHGVDLMDYSEVARNWQKQDCPSGCGRADIDNSGTVDIADLLFVAADWMMF